MSAPTLEITEPGILTTVQDRGRFGYQRFGVPVSGAMDEFALRAANLLVGNDQSAAGLEITVVGPGIRFQADTWIAITGAELSPTIDGAPVARWETVEARAGTLLAFGELRDGMRTYVAVAGGIDVPLVMESRSTYVKAAFGGLEGRPLRKGDLLFTLPLGSELGSVHRRLPDGFEPPTYGERHELRIILGPQDGEFTPEALDTLLGSEYVVSLESDRMGYRLEGPALAHRSGPDIVSDGIPPGAIQVPGDGLPTVLLADRGTTGGYTKIATVIGVDLGTLAQTVPGETVTFREATIEEAHEALDKREAVLRGIASQGLPAPRRLRVLIDGEPFEVVDDSGELVSDTGPLGEAVSGHSRQARATVDGHTFDFKVEVQREE